MGDITNINSKRSMSNSNKQNESKDASNVDDDLSVATTAASRLKDIEKKLKKASSVDKARVAEVQSAISSGEYTVDADRIADKILSAEDFSTK